MSNTNPWGFVISTLEKSPSDKGGVDCRSKQFDVIGASFSTAWTLRLPNHYPKLIIFMSGLAPLAFDMETEVRIDRQPPIGNSTVTAHLSRTMNEVDRKETWSVTLRANAEQLQKLMLSSQVS